MKKSLLFFFLLFSLKGFSQTCTPNTNSLQFDGFSSNVTLLSDNNMQLTNAVTVEAWVNATTFAFNSANGSIFCKHGWSTGPEQGFVLRAGSPGELSFNIAGADINGLPTSWQQVLSPANSLVLNTWYHVAGTFDGTMLKVYINGVLVGSTPFTGTMVPNPSYPARIGELSDAGVNGRNWTGRIDEVRVWDYARTAAELLANYNTHIDPAVQTGLIGYWRFNEGSGTGITDLSNSGNNGTANSVTWSTVVPFSQQAAMPTIIPNGFVLTSTPATTYQWNLNGVAISGATNQSHTAVLNGSYTVTVTDSIGCQATSGFYLIAGITGLVELNKDLQLNTKQDQGIINVSWAKGKHADLIQLIDINGKTVFSAKANTESGSDIITSSFAKGIYLLNIQIERSHFSSKIFID